MFNWLPSLLTVPVDFDKSHLFFPMIVQWILLILLVVIAAVYGAPMIRGLKSGDRKISPFVEHYDKLRFYGTLGLTVIYFTAMDYVGSYFPNMGFGFLFMSIPFMFVLSLLYVHEMNRRKFITITMNSVISPVIAWYVLGNLFNISLP